MIPQGETNKIQTVGNVKTNDQFLSRNELQVKQTNKNEGAIHRLKKTQRTLNQSQHTDFIRIQMSKL